jgi:hypothetical protein
MENLDTLRQPLPLLLPLALIQLGLMIAALLDLARRERTRGPKAVWAAVIILVSTIGPLLYFFIGREEL